MSAGLILTCMNQQGILDTMEKMHPSHMAAACCVFADEDKAVPDSLSYWKFAVFGVTQNHAVCEGPELLAQDRALQSLSPCSVP